MGFADWATFSAHLDRHRQCVQESFQAVIAEPTDESSDDEGGVEWTHLWLDDLGDDELSEALAARGFEDALAAARVLIALKKSRALAGMQAEGRRRLDALMPRLLACLHERQQGAGGAANWVDTLARIIVLVEKVARRSAYLLLLVENPNALNQLVRLCGASSWIADELAQHPALLDELLDQTTLYNPPGKEELRDELRQQVLRIEVTDLEGQMEALRYFRQAHGLRVAASEVTEVLPLMKVSDYLTWLAEVILEHVLALAWQQMLVRHGRPKVGAGGETPEFIVVGYGKVGGIELGHGSDLDLVFIHDADARGYSEGVGADGDRSIDNQTFFTRLGQKMIHILNTRTASGPLYEVDMRLRPSGNSGLLVTSLAAFENYQCKEAWTWEHQALTRTRVVAGGAHLSAAFEGVREQLLCQPRACDALRDDVVAMREKMRAHLGSKPAEQAAQFHLKQDVGGVVDIEFLVQHAVLAWAHNTPSLTSFSDNIRILEILASEGLMGEDEVVQLVQAYKTYRSAGHRLSLQRLPGVVEGQAFSVEREQVRVIWAKYLG